MPQFRHTEQYGNWQIFTGLILQRYPTIINPVLSQRLPGEPGIYAERSEAADLFRGGCMILIERLPLEHSRVLRQTCRYDQAKLYEQNE